jgi:CheY-like chemotaxis protein
MLGMKRLEKEWKQSSGTLDLGEDTLEYASTTFGSFRVPVHEIMLVGEYSSPDPLADDHFLALFARDGTRHDASLYARGAQDVLEELGSRLGAPLYLQLPLSHEPASRILWPVAYAGQPLFEYHEVLPRTITGRLLHRLGNRDLEESLSDAAREVLTNPGGEVRQRPSILIAEDEESVRIPIRARLSKAGYVVEEAKDGVDAMAKLRSHPHDVIILDLAMPKMNGVDVLRRVREEHIPVRIIVISGHEELLDRADRSSVNAILAKPFEIEDLLKELREFDMRRQTNAAI